MNTIDKATWAVLGSIWMLILIRNFWVYYKRQQMISRDFENYHRLESYHFMMFHFWQWDFKKFIRPEPGATIIGIRFNDIQSGEDYPRKDV